MSNKIWQSVFPELDLTEYHADIRNKPVKQKSLAEFIVFDRKGFLLLYPARFGILLIMGMLTILLSNNNFLTIVAALISLFAGYKTIKVILMINRLPSDTVFYDLEVRQNKFFGVIKDDDDNT